MSKGDFPKGHIPWNKGLKIEYKPRLKMVGHVPWNKGLTKEVFPQLSNSGRKRGFVHSKVGTGGYVALHNWVKRNRLKPAKCEHCEQIKKLQLANKSRSYKWDL